MGQYSIKDIELLSGIKAHTLRIWEQRYKFMLPLRTETNIRYYNDEQLKTILNIALLNRHGYKISRIAEMESAELRSNVLKLMEDQGNPDALLDGLIHSMVDFDETRFEKTLNTAIVRMGFSQAFEQLIVPFLERTGLLWSTGMIKPIQEHFMSNLIRRKLSVAIDEQYFTRTEHTKKLVLFLPEGEWHDLMLMYTDYTLRANQHEVVYLGASVPAEDILTLGTTFKPDFLVLFITAPLQFLSTEKFLQKLSSTYANKTILVGGPQLAKRESILPHNVIYISSPQSLLDAVGQDLTISKIA